MDSHPPHLLRPNLRRQLIAIHDLYLPRPQQSLILPQQFPTLKGHFPLNLSRINLPNPLIFHTLPMIPYDNLTLSWHKKVNSLQYNG
jgi:hypothetical protein